MFEKLRVKVASRWDLKVDDLEKIGAEDRRRGVIIHAALSLTKSLDDLKSPEVLLRKALILVGEDADVKEFERYVRAVAEVKGVERFFPEKDAKVYVEREFTDGKGNVIRPDRVVVYGDRVLVLDYKSATASKEQVVFYCYVLKGIFARRVEGYLLFVKTGRLERVYP